MVKKLEELNKTSLIEYFDEVLNKIEKAKLEQDITELEILIQTYKNDIENLNKQTYSEFYIEPKTEVELGKKQSKHKTSFFSQFLKKIFNRKSNKSQKNVSKIKEETPDEKRKRMLKDRENKLSKLEKNIQEKKSKLGEIKNKTEIYNHLDIDAKYKNKKVISEFKEYLENGECNNYNECVSIYEKKISKMQMERKINEKEKEEKIRQEEERRHKEWEERQKKYEEERRKEEEERAKRWREQEEFQQKIKMEREIKNEERKRKKEARRDNVGEKSHFGYTEAEILSIIHTEPKLIGVDYEWRIFANALEESKYTREVKVMYAGKLPIYIFPYDKRPVISGSLFKDGVVQSGGGWIEKPEEHFDAKKVKTGEICVIHNGKRLSPKDMDFSNKYK